MQGKQLSGGLVQAIVRQITQPTFATTDNNTLERSGFTALARRGKTRRNFVAVDHKPPAEVASV